MKFKTCITLLILHLLIISRAEAQHRIMTLGNSITQSNGSYQSYRYPLWKKLVDAKINFDLVGSMRNNYNSNPYWPVYNGLAFDQDHEGHWGWRADEILNGKSGLGKLSDWLQGYTPDIVLLHLGTNDLIFGYGVPSTLEDLRQIVGVIRAKNPQVKILLAKLIPGSTSSFVKTTIEAFNQQVPALAQELHQSDSPVIVVDQFSGYESVLDNYDGLHPNARGEEKMATKWFEAISSIIRSCPPAPTAIPKAICGPGLVTLTASGAPITGSYRWYTTSLGGTPLQNATSASFTTPMLSATTTYYVSVVNNSCESARVPVTATINLIPPVAVSASSNVIPAGGSTTLTASGASSYVWSPVTGLSSSTGATVMASPAITTTYLVTCTSKNGCVNTTAVTVSVNSGKLSQVINFPPILDKMYGDAPFNLTATSSANLQVQYSIVSGPAILSGRTLTMTGVGTVVVRAYHPGNDWYLAATPVKVSFNVLNSSARQSQSIYFASIPDKTLEDAPFALNATASSGLPVTYSLVLGPATVSAEIVTLTGIGTVTIRAMQVGSDSYHPASAERSFTVKSGNTSPTVCGLMLTSNVSQAEPWYGMWGVTYGAGAINLEVSGGTAPYTYRWNTGVITEDIAVAVPGQYLAKVTDAKGCTAFTTVYVGQKNKTLMLATSKADVSVAGGQNGSIDLSVMGGGVPFKYRWSNGATTEDLTGLAAGTYTVTVTDAFGKMATISVQVSAPVTPTLASAKKPVFLEGQAAQENDLTIYPNPAQNYITATFSLQAAGSYAFELYDMRGVKVKTIATGKTAGDKEATLILDVTGCAKGIYLLKLITVQSISSRRIIIES